MRSDFPKQLRKRNPRRLCDPLDVYEREVALAASYASNIGPIQLTNHLEMNRPGRSARLLLNSRNLECGGIRECLERTGFQLLASTLSDSIVDWVPALEQRLALRVILDLLRKLFDFFRFFHHG